MFKKSKTFFSMLKGSLYVAYMTVTIINLFGLVIPVEKEISESQNHIDVSDLESAFMHPFSERFDFCIFGDACRL